jgi:hypothetical protein
MEFKVSELEREAISFDLKLPPGAVDYGEEAEQVGNMATSGLAEVIHEHRGPREIVADIRLRGMFSGTFQIPCARCVEPVETPLSAEFDLIFRPGGVDTEAPERSITAPETEIGFCPCPSEAFASLNAKDFARAAAQTAISSPAPAMWVRVTPAGKRWPVYAARSSLKKFERSVRKSSHAQSEKAPLNAPHRTPPLPRFSHRYGHLRVPKLP